MQGTGRLTVAALAAVSLLTMLPKGSFAACSLMTGTADGWNKDDASAGARIATMV
jgi:hypothetical protein